MSEFLPYSYAEISECDGRIVLYEEDLSGSSGCLQKEILSCKNMSIRNI